MAVLGGGWWVTGSKIFELKTLRVAGTSHLSPAQVARLAGLTQRTNVFWFSSSRVQRKLELDPWVASAKVSRTLPSEVTVVIKERLPVAVVSPSSGLRLLVAADGTVLGRAVRTRGLPAIAGSVRHAGSRSWIDPRTPGLMVASQLPGAARSAITSIEVALDGQVTLSLPGEVQVVFGDLTQAGVKGQALVAVLSWADRNGVRPASVDVSAPGAPALLPAGASAGRPSAP